MLSGRVVATVEAGKGSSSVSIDRAVPVDESGWLAVRASGPPHPDHPAPMLYGHTSPVYLVVPGKPISAKSDAEYFLHWIDRLDSAVQERNRIPSRRRPHVKEQLDAARAVYRKLAGSRSDVAR